MNTNEYALDDDASQMSSSCRVGLALSPNFGSFAADAMYPFENQECLGETSHAAIVAAIISPNRLQGSSIGFGSRNYIANPEDSGTENYIIG